MEEVNRSYIAVKVVCVLSVLSVIKTKKKKFFSKVGNTDLDLFAQDSLSHENLT